MPTPTRAKGALAAALALATALSAGQAAAKDPPPDMPRLDAGAALVAGCTRLALPAQAERACTAAIGSGLWQGAEIAWAWNNLGLARAARGDMLGAIDAYDRAIALDPGLAPAYSNRGNARAALGDMLPALADHTRATELDPDYVAAWHNRAVDLEELGRYAAALDGYRKVLSLDADHPGAHVGLATAACKLGRVQASAAARLEAIRKGHIDPFAIQRMLQVQGFYKGAIDGVIGPASRRAIMAWTRAGCLAPA